jgi:hypothetical protein
MCFCQDGNGVKHPFKPVLITKEVGVDSKGRSILRIQVDSTATAILRMASEVIQ